jgi:aldehyde:ferredoxin oxidoreductase
MRVRIQGEIEMTSEDFEKLGQMLITKQAGFEVTYRGVAIQKAWLPKRVMKQYKRESEA